MNSDDNNSERGFCWLGFLLGIAPGYFCGRWIGSFFASHTLTILVTFIITLLFAVSCGRYGYSIWDMLWDIWIFK
jgi:hypothetical protein